MPRKNRLGVTGFWMPPQNVGTACPMLPMTKQTMAPPQPHQGLPVAPPPECKGGVRREDHEQHQTRQADEDPRKVRDPFGDRAGRIARERPAEERAIQPCSPVKATIRGRLLAFGCALCGRWACRQNCVSAYQNENSPRLRRDGGETAASPSDLPRHEPFHARTQSSGPRRSSTWQRRSCELRGVSEASHCRRASRGTRRRPRYRPRESLRPPG